MSILIAGGGIGGLTLALSLHQIGAEAAAVSTDTTTCYPISAPVHLIYGENSPSLLRNPEKYTPGIMGLARR
jgi:Trk K+ transport system NAD-binding subunit